MTLLGGPLLFDVCQSGVGIYKQVNAYHPSPVRVEHCCPAQCINDTLNVLGAWNCR